MWEIILNSEVLAAAVTALGGLAIYYFKIRKDRFPKYLRDTKLLKIILNSLAHDLGTARLILLEGHNGGGMPKIGRPFYATIIEEVAGQLPPIQADFEDVELDIAYISMLCDVYTAGVMAIHTEDLEEGLLKTIYEASGINQSIVFSIGISGKSLYYCSANFTDPDNKMTPINKNLINNFQRKLKKILL